MDRPLSTQARARFLAAAFVVVVATSGLLAGAILVSGLPTWAKLIGLALVVVYGSIGFGILLAAEATIAEERDRSRSRWYDEV